MIEPDFKRITKLSKTEIECFRDFDCGVVSLNSYLIEDAKEDALEGNTKTYLIYIEEKFVGYFSLVSDRVLIINRSKLHDNKNGIKRFSRTGTTNVPAIQIRHLAIRQDLQKQGYGRDILDRILLLIRNFILPYMGATLITVYSLKTSVGFYEKYGFKKTGDRSKDTINHCMALHTDAIFENVSTA